MRVYSFLIIAGFLLLIIALGLGLGASTPQPSIPIAATLTAPREVWVDDDDPTCAGKQPCFASIQSAIDVVAPTGKVHIRSGNYRENMLVTKEVELQGAGRDLVRIEARDPDKPLIFVSGAPCVLGGLGLFGGTVGIQVERVENVPSNYSCRIFSNYIRYYTEVGIRLIHSGRKGLGVIINNNEIQSTMPDPRDPAIPAIEVWESSVVEIRENVIHSFIHIRGPMTSAHIAGNVLLGLGVYVDSEARAFIAFNQFKGIYTPSGGIVASGALSVDILHNEISSNGPGIEIIDSGEVSIIRNVIFHSNVGIVIGKKYVREEEPRPKIPNLTISMNRIMMNAFGGMWLYQGGTIERRAKIENNYISENGEAGVRFGSQVRMDFSNNWVINNVNGICPDDPLGKSDPEALVGSNNKIHDNLHEDLCKIEGKIDYPWPPGFRK